MNDIATQTNGDYYFSPTAQELQSIYNSISGAISGKSTILTKSGSVQQGSTSVETASIDSSVTEATFSVSWSGSDINLTLEDPNGSIIDPVVAASEPNITYTSGATYEFYNILSPMPGDWKLNITGVYIPTGTEKYTINVAGKTGLTMETFFDRDQYSLGEPIKVSKIYRWRRVSTSN